MKLNELVQKLAPILEKQEKRDRQTVDAKRRTDFAALARVEESRLKGVKERRPGLEKRHDAIADLEQQLRDARQALARDRAHDGSECYHGELQAERLEQNLRETADPAISEFVERMKGELDNLQRWPIAHNREATGKIDLRTGGAITVGYSEVFSLKRRLQGVRAAIAAAHALELLVDVDVGERLRALESGLPSIKMELVA